MTISILVEPSQVGFRATTGGPMQLSAEAASPAEAVKALQDLITVRLEHGAILIDHPVHPPRPPIPVLSLSENPLFDSWLAEAEIYRAEREILESSKEQIPAGDEITLSGAVDLDSKSPIIRLRFGGSSPS